MTLTHIAAFLLAIVAGLLFGVWNARRMMRLHIRKKVDEAVTAAMVRRYGKPPDGGSEEPKP